MSSPTPDNIIDIEPLTEPEPPSSSSSPAIPLDLPPERSPRTINFERKESRTLLEVYLGLPAIIEALEFAIADEPQQDAEGRPVPPSKFRQMYEHMLDPSISPLPEIATGGRPKYAIDTIMARYGVRLPELLSMIGARNLGMAIAKSGTRLEKVIDGIGEAAEPHLEECEVCRGEGYLPGIDDESEAPMCRKCQGEGVRKVKGDLKAAEMFIGLHGGNTKAGSSGGGNVTNVSVLAQASAKVARQTSDTSPDPVTVRVQKLIEQ